MGPMAQMANPQFVNPTKVSCAVYSLSNFVKSWIGWQALPGEHPLLQVQTAWPALAARGSSSTERGKQDRQQGHIGAAAAEACWCTTASQQRRPAGGESSAVCMSLHQVFYKLHRYKVDMLLFVGRPASLRRSSTCATCLSM